MQLGEEMNELVYELLGRYWQEEFDQPIDLVLTMAGHAHLVIKELMRYRLLRVGTYLTSPEGKLLPDPAILFAIEETGEWIPIEITRILGGQWIVGALHPVTGVLHIADKQGQAALAAYTYLWVYNLRLQGWLEQAQRIASQRE